MIGKIKTPCNFCNKVRKLAGIKKVVLVDKKTIEATNLNEFEEKFNNENNA